MPIAPHPVEWRPLPEDRLQPASAIRITILHSIVGSAEGAYGFFLNSTDLESHFIIKLNGHIIQCINTDRSADANYKANKIAISIETEDNGDPDNDPWTSAQIESILWLLEWTLKAHPEMTRRECVEEFGDGLGFHSKFGAPSAWTPVPGKTCPGTIRKHQFWNLILPRFLYGQTTKPEPTEPLREETDMLIYVYNAGTETKKDDKLFLDRGGVVTDITAHPLDFWQLAGPGRIPVIGVSKGFLTAIGVAV